MEREELKGKQTPGIAACDLNKFGFGNGDAFLSIRVDVEEELPVLTTETVARVVADPDEKEGRANAALYAEAHNVANETKMWPREMQERIKKLEDLLYEGIGYARQCTDSEGADEFAQRASAFFITPSTIN